MSRAHLRIVPGTPSSTKGGGNAGPPDAAVATQAMVERFASQFQLSERERQVCALVAVGHPEKEVGAILGLGSKTAESYRRRAYAKVGVRDRSSLRGALFTYACDAWVKALTQANPPQPA